MKAEADSGPHHHIDMYRHVHTIADAPRLPPKLLDGLRECEKDDDLQAAIGKPFSCAYLQFEHAEGNAYMSGSSAREHRATLDV